MQEDKKHEKNNSNCNMGYGNFVFTIFFLYDEPVISSVIWLGFCFFSISWSRDDKGISSIP